MSSCKVCHLDSKKHSKKMWALHQQAQICTLCQKNASEHSEKLWEMHKRAMEKGRVLSIPQEKSRNYIQSQLEPQGQALQEYAGLMQTRHMMLILYPSTCTAPIQTVAFT